MTLSAVDWLQPESAVDSDHERWRGLHDRVAAFATRPVPGVPAPPQLLSALHAVLDEYSVAFSSNIHLGCLVAAVVVKAQGKQEGAWVFDFMTPANFLTNDPNRCVSAIVSVCAPCVSVQLPEHPLTCLLSDYSITLSALAAASIATSSRRGMLMLQQSCGCNTDGSDCHESCAAKFLFFVSCCCDSLPLCLIRHSWCIHPVPD